MQDILAGTEIALCAMLLVCALLLRQSLDRVLRDNGWLNQERVVTVEISPSPKEYQQAPARVALYRDLLRETSQLPGVSGAGLINALPLHGEVWGGAIDLVEAPRREIDQPIANFRFISPGYDNAVGLTLADGRQLRESDFGKPLIWVSESVTREYAGRHLIGMHVLWSQPGAGKTMSLEVAGVMRDVRAEAEKQPPLTAYVPYWLWPPWDPTLVVRASMDPAGVAAGVQRLLRRAHREVPILRVQTLRDTLNTAVASRRFLTTLGEVFAGSAALLAALGVYGVVALAGARRRREIAIRMTVGASHAEILRMVLARAAGLSIIGGTAGLAGGAALARAMASLLYEVRTGDAALYAMTCAIVIAIGLAASLAPAIRAARVDPVVTLKYD